MKQTTQEITTITDNVPVKYQWKGNKKQKLAMSYWITPGSGTFGNAYKSFKLAGFSNSYCLNITHLAPKWLSEYMEKLDMTDEHIKQGIQALALSAENSRSPDDTRLKAWEILSDIKGMTGKNKGVTTNVIVQPILNGASVHPDSRPPIQKEVIDLVPEE